jgi:hypothetical protein
MREISVQKKTILNINRACGTPSTSGIMANIIGTAPRNPTQEIYTLSLLSIFRNGSKHKNTVSGREKNIIEKLIIRPGIIIGISSCGFTNKPSVKNMINCAIHANPSKKPSEERLCTNFELPITKPPIYTAKKPFPLAK